MKTSKKGYLRNSPDVNKPQNIIKGGDITMKGVDFNVHGIDSNGYAKVMTPGNNYKFPNAEYVIETPIKNNKKMNKDLKYMPIDDKAGTFMSKHCSPVSYGTPLEKKSCGSPNKKIYPIELDAVDLGVVKSSYKGKERKLPFPGKEMYEGTGDMAQFGGKYTPKMLEMNRTYTQKWNEANIPNYREMKRKQLEAEAAMTEEQKSRDDY